MAVDIDDLTQRLMRDYFSYAPMVEALRELAALRATLLDFAYRAEAWHADPSSSVSALIDLANDIIDASEALATKEARDGR